tara:strand:+ start:7066 stop:7869 length:804 start_codon:yes stop_codon:yes gene_type:complete
MSLKAILESHPIKNLNAVIRSVKSDIAPKLALSKDRKRHSKEKLIEHILALDKMGLLKQRPTMYEKPVRTKKVKAEPKKATAKEIADSLMVPGKYTKKEIKEGKALVKNQPKKKAEPKAVPKAVPKKEQINFEEGEKRFQKIKKLFRELEKGLNQGQLKSFNNDVKEYIKLDVNTSGDTETADIKNHKKQLQKDYNRLYKIFLGKVKTKKAEPKKAEPKKAEPKKKTAEEPKKAKKPRSEKQKANDKRLGEAKKRARAKRPSTPVLD